MAGKNWAVEFLPPLGPQCSLVGASGIVWFGACLWGPAKGASSPGRSAGKGYCWFLSEMGSWSPQEMCLEGVCSHLLEPAPALMPGLVLPPSQSYSVFLAALFIPTPAEDPRQSPVLGGRATGAPRPPNPICCLYSRWPRTPLLPWVWLSIVQPGGGRSPSNVELLTRGPGETHSQRQDGRGRRSPGTALGC